MHDEGDVQRVFNVDETYMLLAKSQTACTIGPGFLVGSGWLRASSQRHKRSQRARGHKGGASGIWVPVAEIRGQASTASRIAQEGAAYEVLAAARQGGLR